MNRKLLVGITIAAMLGAIGTVVYAVGVISNQLQLPTITVTAGGGGGSPPSNSQLVLSSPDFTSPVNIFTGGNVTATVRVLNPSPGGAPGYTGVALTLRILKTGIVSTDASLDSWDGAGWVTVPLIATDGVLSGEYTIGAVPTSFDGTTLFRVTTNASGIYQLTAEAHN